MLETRALSVAHGGQPVVKAVDLQVQAAEWLTVIGPNGAGKSSLLHAVAGLVRCGGEVIVNGRPVASESRRWHARQVALVPQRPVIPRELTVAEYVLLGRTPHIGYFAAEGRSDRLAAERAIVRLGLRRFVSRTIGSLSGGEMQRVLIARALAQEAPVLLLDEPTSALDIGKQQLTLELIDRLRHESGLAVLSAMHDLSLAALYADRLLLLDAGEVVAHGTSAEVLSESVIAPTYGADVTVIHEAGRIYVLPRRRSGGATWAH